MESICYSSFCPCCAYGENFQKLYNKDSCLAPCNTYCIWTLFGCIVGQVVTNHMLGAFLLSRYYTCVYNTDFRLSLKKKYNLPIQKTDYLIHFLCSPCAIYQESNYLENINGNIIGLEEINMEKSPDILI